MQISSFRKKNSSVNSQLLKEVNFENLFRNLEHSILWNSVEEISLLWLVNRPLFTNIEWSVDDVVYMAFESLFPIWKCLL